MANKISDDDREQIRLAVEALPDIDHRIVSITAEGPGMVVVRTGAREGRAGAGRILHATQSDSGKWWVELVGGWRS